VTRGANEPAGQTIYPNHAQVTDLHQTAGREAPGPMTGSAASGNDRTIRHGTPSYHCETDNGRREATDAEAVGPIAQGDHMTDVDKTNTVEDRDVHKEYAIIVNTRPEVVALAFPGAHGTDVTFTITYHRAVAPLHEGNLSEGGQVTIKNGTIFDVTRTTRS
jgi:hypothetical protein